MLAGKVALVTGGSRGIGKAICIELAKLGAKVVVNYATNANAAEDVVDKCKSYNVEAIAIKADVSSAIESENLIKKVIENFGRIDILVNNAGITKDNLILRMTEEEFDNVIDTNLKSAFLCSKHTARIMLKQRSGRIINISSVVGISGNAGQVNYAASKAGIIGLTKSLAKELASRNITVNAVAPGFIETDMTKELKEDSSNSLLQSIPLNRIGDAKDVANAVAFLAGESAGYITGHILNVDGGMSM